MSIFKWGASSINRTLCFAVLAALLAVVVTACRGMSSGEMSSGEMSSGEMSSHGDHSSSSMGEHGSMAETTVDGLTISNAMAGEAPLEGGNGAVYMTLTSERADQFISAESPAAAMVELHESMDDNGVMRMEPRPDGFEIPAGEQVELKRGGKHIMLMNLTDALKAGNEIEITLNFRNRDSVTITVPVMEIGAMQH